MKESKHIARNYAQALVELAGGDLNTQESFLFELKTINESMHKVSGANQLFENPGISKEEKKNLIKKIFSEKINITNLNFLLLLIDKQRFNILPEIQNELAKIVNKNKGIVIAEVNSASELDVNTIESLRQKLELQLQKNEKITIEQKIKPELIGGVVVKINDLVYDGSIRGRLENLKRRILN